MKVVDALICIDCEELFTGRHTHCPGCSSPSFYPLRMWIKPYEEAEELKIYECPSPVLSINW